MERQEQIDLPVSEEELREMFNEDQAGTLWKIFWYVREVDRSIESRSRSLLKDFDPEKFQKMVARERQEYIVSLLSGVKESD
jgi:hypothetical protein